MPTPTTKASWAELEQLPYLVSYTFGEHGGGGEMFVLGTEDVFRCELT